MTGKSMLRCKARENGFTLVEVLVALAILSVALTVLFAIFSHTLSRNAETRTRMAARVLASSLIAQAEAAPDLTVGTTSGEAKPALEWHLAVAPYGDAQERQAWPSAAVRITATVSWGKHASGQSFALSTLRLLPKGLKP
jgi:general secretion pathway protein I